MNDMKSHEHGDEGPGSTHWACDARMKKEGGEAKCCECCPHDGCGHGLSECCNEYLEIFADAKRCSKCTKVYLRQCPTCKGDGILQVKDWPEEGLSFEENRMKVSIKSTGHIGTTLSTSPKAEEVSIVDEIDLIPTDKEGRPTIEAREGKDVYAFKAEGVGECRRILDLFCGAGGASMGLHRIFPNAEIVGVDIVPQPDYPFTFVQGDALEYPLEGFDLIWASPPCQAHTALKGAAWDKKAYKEKHPDLIPKTRERLIASGTPYIIENVVGAPLVNPVMLCGSQFDLHTADGHQLRRHRLFETSFPVALPGECRHTDKTIGIFGSKARNTAKEKQHYSKPKETRGPPPDDIGLPRAAANEAMEVEWMSMKELSQAIPPAYSSYIASQFLLTSAVRAAEERKDQEMLDFCLSICANDKTPRYGYDGRKERNANAYGQFPDEGRWCTPNEMAADKANKIKQKRKSLPPPPDKPTQP